MPPLFKFLRELDPSNVNQAVKLRLIRSYKLHVGEDTTNVYSLECVLHDAEGQRIHASIKRAFISRFSNLFKEEHIFAIKNFVLANNNLKLKTTSSDYKMVFIPKTTVVEVFDPHFPRNVFAFKMYDNLSLWESLDEESLIDVIGSLSSRSTKQTREVQGRETTMVDITIKNLQGNVLPCTLWAEYAEQLLHHVEEHEGPIVVILQMCRVKKFRGEVRLSNTFKVSKVILDDTVPEIEDFNSGLVQEGNVEIPVTTIFNPSTVTIPEELAMSRDKILPLNRLIRVQEIDQFWVFCQVVAIEPMFDWFYVSCKKCCKKMAQAGTTFYCVQCDVTDPVGSLRYRILVRVADNWGIASLILWDKECVTLIGKTAGELQATSNGEPIPKAISRIIGLKALFKVNVKDFSTGINLGPFPVMKMTSDMHVINHFCNISSVSNVDLHEKEEGDNLLAPVQHEKVKSTPTVICVGVKRNLLNEFSGNEEEKEATRAKTEPVTELV